MPRYYFDLFENGSISLTSAGLWLGQGSAEE